MQCMGLTMMSPTRPCLQWGCPSSEQWAQHCVSCPCHTFPIHPIAVLRHGGLKANGTRSYGNCLSFHGNTEEHRFGFRVQIEHCSLKVTGWSVLRWEQERPLHCWCAHCRADGCAPGRAVSRGSVLLCRAQGLQADLCSSVGLTALSWGCTGAMPARALQCHRGVHHGKHLSGNGAEGLSQAPKERDPTLQG